MSNDKFLHDRLYYGKDFDKFDKKKICICGVGTVGSNLLDNLVRQNISNLKVVDDDRVEPHNLGNQIWKSENLGQKKVDAAKIHAYNVSEAMIETFGKRLTDKNVKKVFKDVDLVVDCFDNSLSRALVKDYCVSANVPCLHVGLAEDYCEVVWNSRYIVPRDVDGDVCEYPMTRQISLMSVVLATREIINFLTSKEESNVYFTLKDFKLGRY